MGYLLGLGDRHPSNLMLDRYSGKLLHIDFGDCFEASMNREKFPERVRESNYDWSHPEQRHTPALFAQWSCRRPGIAFCVGASTYFCISEWTWTGVAECLIAMLCFVQVPFRLTRMMVKAMEVSGVEGNFRFAKALVPCRNRCKYAALDL